MEPPWRGPVASIARLTASTAGRDGAFLMPETAGAFARTGELGIQPSASVRGLETFSAPRPLLPSEELLGPAGVVRAIASRSSRAPKVPVQPLGNVDGGALAGLVGTSPPMRVVYAIARRVAAARATVLLTGETGTGKGELARAIHALSPRAHGPFVALHCAALAESLLESELFGHERGAFTGADKRRTGRFEQADRGTLFLDEVGEISPLLQVKLLRVLQERTFERVGGNESVKVDVRLLAATNRDLLRDVHEGRFREDLYYRLNVVRIEMPPLRRRGGDVQSLADYFLGRFSTESGVTRTFTERARMKLASHPWHGNVRELENAIERAVVLSTGTAIDAADLPFETEVKDDVQVPGSTMAAIERRAIEATLDATGGSTVRAAAILGISIRKLQYRLLQYRRPTPE